MFMFGNSVWMFLIQLLGIVKSERIVSSLCFEALVSEEWTFWLFYC